MARISVAYGLLTIRDVPDEELPRLKNQLTSAIGHLTTKSKSSATGSVKRAIKLGRVPLTRDHLNDGYSVGGLLRLQHSEVHGTGVFAMRDIEPEHCIIAIRGVLIPSDTPQNHRRRKYTWKPAGYAPFKIEQYKKRFANIVRYMNSSGEAAGNVEIVWMCSKRVAVVRALTPIAAGEELLCKYPLI